MGNDDCAEDCERFLEISLKEEELQIPYTYTLPQQFIEDKEVPTRWRVWAVINGFFIAGQYCWASNEWLAKKVKSHKDTVSQAVKELEGMDIIHCKRGARSREIYPMIGINAYQWSARTPISDRHQRLSISVSNSEKNTSATRIERVPPSEESEQRPARAPAKYPHAKEVSSWFPNAEPSWLMNTTELKHMELLYLRGKQKVISILSFIETHKEEEYFPKVTKPSDLERKWEDIKAYRV